jgi:hypothetical protein
MTLIINTRDGVPLCRVSQLMYYYAECHYAECLHAECRYAECHCTECHGAHCRACAINHLRP